MLLALLFFTLLEVHGKSVDVEFLSTKINKEKRLEMSGSLSLIGIELNDIYNLGFRYGLDMCGVKSSDCGNEKSCTLDVTDCLPVGYQDALKKSFDGIGPNCFSTALKVTGLYPTYRGVDVKEFEAFTKLACKVVERPVPGDIGVFAFKDSTIFHAFVYVSQNIGLQKPGADYGAGTSIGVTSIKGIHYTYAASDYCKQYSRTKEELASCSNPQYYLRCEEIEWGYNPWIKNHNLNVAEVEKVLMTLIEKKSFSSEDKSQFFRTEVAVRNLKISLDIESREGDLDQDQLDYFNGRIQSLEHQLEFLKPKATY